MRIEAALERFLTQLDADGRSVHTRKQYERHIRLLASWAHHERSRCDQIEKLGHERVAEFLSSPTATGRAGGGMKKPTAMNCLRSSVRTFLRYCHAAGYSRDDAGRMIKRAWCGTPPPRALSDEDQRRLLSVLRKARGPEAERDHALFALMLASGLRLGSALALDVEDIDLARGELQIRSTKGNRPEQAFLGRAINRHLARYLRDHKRGPVSLARGRRVSRRHVQRRLRQWLEKAGVTGKASCHSLRHTFGARIYAKTHDLLLTQAALMHRSIASTTIYVRTDEARLRRVL